MITTSDKMIKTICCAALVILFTSCEWQSGDSYLEQGFLSPSREYYPETWFHINGNNITREGLTKDLEAISYAGIQGIQLFNKSGAEYPGVPQVQILSSEWRDMIGHVANECERLGLRFALQNCPGWAMSGGPWVPIEEAQRELVHTVTRVTGGNTYDDALLVDARYLGADFDYKDVYTIAFPTPEGDTEGPFIPVSIKSNNHEVSWESIFNPEDALRGLGQIRNNPARTVDKTNGDDSWVQLYFAKPVTIRSIVLPPIRSMRVTNQYPRVDVRLIIQSVDGEHFKTVAEIPLPHTNWMDQDYDLTLAIPETTTQELRITFSGDDYFSLGFMTFGGQPRIHNYETKAAYASRSLESDYNPYYGSESMIDPESILNLTDKMDESGRLTWEIPLGNWTIVRFGHVNMRKMNGPAAPEARGWETSKLDKIAIENHLRNGMIGDLLEPNGPIAKGQLHGLLLDSWERGVQTWTIDSDGLFNEFLDRRGYDMRTFMPAMMGYIVKDQSTTEKFLFDLRQTMDDLYVENYFIHFRTVSHEFGAIVFTEGAAGEVLPGDALRYYGEADIPMTEFWFPGPPSQQPLDGKPIIYAASATNVYNKPYLAAEALTQGSVTWREHPFIAKYLVDLNFTRGVNHLIFHTFSHTPQKVVYPGSSFGSHVGFPLVRNQTWWRHTPSWITHLARTQFMLQQGKFVADVLWYLGDQLDRPPFETDPFPDGHRFDFFNSEILHTRLSVKDNITRVKDGGDYKVIMLRNSKRMLRSTAEKIHELVMAGAIVLGDKPVDSPSLTDSPEDVEAMLRMADELWGEGDSGMNKVGKGKIYWGMSIWDVLSEENISRDVVIPDDIEIPWIHRKTEHADIYFLSNQNEYPLDAAISFRIEDKIPEIWDMHTGEIKQAGVFKHANGRTNVAVSFDPHGSAIVVFRKKSKGASVTKIECENQTLLDCSDGWYRILNENNLIECKYLNNELTANRSGIYNVTRSDGKQYAISLDVTDHLLNHDWGVYFTEGWDTPGYMQFPHLISLSEHNNEAVAYYSGTVTYEKNVQIEKIESKMILDLGDVANIAEVWVNDEKIGTRWAPPFIFDIAPYVKEGENNLQVLVTNTWRNQLLYDIRRAEEQKKTWTTNPPQNANETPSPSGLIGPVVIRSITSI